MRRFIFIVATVLTQFSCATYAQAPFERVLATLSCKHKTVAQGVPLTITIDTERGLIGFREGDFRWMFFAITKIDGLRIVASPIDIDRMLPFAIDRIELTLIDVGSRQPFATCEKTTLVPLPKAKL